MSILPSLETLKSAVLKIKNLWQLRKKSESIASVDIGSSSIKIVQLRREKEKAVLETYGELSLSRYGDAPVGQAIRLTDEKIIEAIKDLKKEAGIKAEKAIIAIPLRYSFLTKISLPLMSDAELEKAIPYEIKRYIPVPLSEVVFDWQILPSPEKTLGLNQEENSGGRRFTDILIVAIYKDFVDKYKNIIKASGFEAAGFEIEVFSGVRSVIYREPKPILIIDLGASKTKMTIVENGALKSAHDFDKGSQDLTLSLSRSLSVDFSRAEEIKREIGISNRPEHKEIREVLEPILNYILSEASRLIAEYRRKEGQAVSRIYLTAGGSLLKGLADFTVNKIGVETLVADPFIKIEYPAFLEGALKESGPIFANAIGLALREV